MDKKKILIGLGVVAVIGIAYYLYNKNKKSAELKNASGDDTSGSAPAPTSENVATTKATLETRKEKRKACGKRPLNKEKRAEWQKCVDAGGSVSFEGDFDEFQDDYMD